MNTVIALRQDTLVYLQETVAEIPAAIKAGQVKK